MSLRHLTADEISQLTLQGCRCTCWDNISVADPFVADRYRNVAFDGCVVLLPAQRNGSYRSTSYEAGIYNARIADCKVGRDVHISNVGNVISDCDICDNAIICNVGTIGCVGATSHGNGVEVDVLSETGGREVPMHYGLTAQEAWAIAMCRHDKAAVDAMKSRIAAIAADARCRRSFIGEHAVVVNTAWVDAVNIRQNAIVESASRLVNGTVGENAYVGTNVIASDFIFAHQSTVDTAARLDHVFVGEGSRVANGFSAHHSLIFSNCILENGEAAALFAGPFTVSMHKSTLLIGCMTSMFNAGSGANQSNHLYKSGPCHHGIMQRGVKLGSGAYIMWPAHIGAFSVVMGSHKSHPDTSALPFSYLVAGASGASQVIPAITLGSIGIARDIDKWPRRDHRPAAPADAITFDLFNPYIAQRIIDGISLLEKMTSSQPDAEIYHGDGFIVTAAHARRGLQLYRDALQYYLLGVALRRVADGMPLAFNETDTAHRWLDVAGMAIPAGADVARICNLNNGDWERSYRDCEWQWVASTITDTLGISLADIDNAGIKNMLDDWLRLDTQFTEMLRRDAMKEFDHTIPGATAGFGLYDPAEQTADFQAVRGALADSSVAAILQSRTTAARTLAAALSNSPINV